MPRSPSAADPYSDGVAPLRVRELASGIDALYLSGQAFLPAPFLHQLELDKGRAMRAGEPVAFDLGGVEFGLAPHGWGRYAYRLSHEFGLIGFTPSLHLPAVRVQPRSEFLHGLGPEGGVDAFGGILASVGPVRLSVARADLFGDFQGWNLQAEDRSGFVCRAKTLDTHEESSELKGLQFGRRSGGGLSVRIYEKSGHARTTGALWWLEKWGSAYRPGEPVFRVECEFGRKILRQCGVDSPADLFREVAGLWGYGTEWLSYRTPTSDLTRSRWPNSPEWEAVRSASLRDRPVTVKRVTDTKRAASERRIVSGLCGFLSVFAALRNVHSIGASLDLADPVLRDYERETGIPFAARVDKKRRHWEWGE